MIAELLKNTAIDSPVASVIISIALMLFCGFLMTRVTKRLHLPNVTAYIITGILIGPFVLNLIPQRVIQGMEFLPDIALAFISFSTGQFFKTDTLKRNGPKVIIITLFEALTASLLVFILAYPILKLNIGFSIVLAALASATASASTMMTIRQTGSKGDFVDTLLLVIALDNVVSLLAYSVAIAIASTTLSGQTVSFLGIVKPIFINIGVMFLGAAFGFLLKLLMSSKRSNDNRLIVSIAILFAFCGICALFDVSPLLGCMSMGTVYINLTDDDKLFKQLNYFSPPLLLLFFVRSGLSFDIGSLLNVNGALGAVPLLLVGILYFIVRILGKYAGAFIGCQLIGKSKPIRNYLGLALIPQAGVAIGLAALGARTLGGEIGAALQTIILSSSILYEIVGPALANMSLYLTHSYSDKIEDLAPVETVDENGKPKTDLELLIERIQKIQEELPAHEIDENEQAYTNAAEEHFEAFVPFRNRRFKR